MTRKDFIKNAGISLISGPFVLKGTDYFHTRSMLKASPPPFNCVLAPTQTGGPFYLDPKLDRKNIVEDRPGMPLKLKIKVLGVVNCEPVPNAVVNIWHCDARGVYSEFGMVSGNPADASGAGWLRGYQVTDENGECEIETIFPGWYPGRATHIHFDVHLGFEPGGTVDRVPDASSTFFSQMYLPNSIKSKVYSDHEAYLEKGDNPTGTNNDTLFQNAGAPEALMLAFDESDYPNSLTAEFCIGLDLAGTAPTRTVNLEGREYFRLKPNFPNPFSSSTEIGFTMISAGTVMLSVFNANGELAAQLMNRRLPGGEYSVEFNRATTDYYLPAGTYLFDMMVHNDQGRFRQSRRLVII